ncbi:MAG: DinB family protein [Candidatus Thorarchaeota archaeon]|nr:DinB family protein [Candidatus Thorarchaeota archaeon]
MIPTVEILLDHNFTCRKPLLESLKKLDNDDFTRNLGIGDTSFRNILVHLMNTEIYWISLLSDMETEKLNPEEFKDIKSIAKTWQMIERKTREFVSNQTEVSLQYVKSVDWKKGTVSFTVAKALIHMATHETHHRGFIIGLLRQMGYEPPDVNML